MGEFAAGCVMAEEPLESVAEVVLPPEVRGEWVAALTIPPLVPPPVQRDHPTRVRVKLEVVEKVMKMTDGVDYTFWTFGGMVPGSFIRVRGGVVDFELMNHPTSKMPHNIDPHAVIGPDGKPLYKWIDPKAGPAAAVMVLNDLKNP